MVDHSTLGWLWRRTGCGTADRPTHRLAVRFLGEAAVDRLIVLDGRASTSGPNWWCARSAAAAASKSARAERSSSRCVSGVAESWSQASKQAAPAVVIRYGVRRGSAPGGLAAVVTRPSAASRCSLL